MFNCEGVFYTSVWLVLCDCARVKRKKWITSKVFRLSVLLNLVRVIVEIFRLSFGRLCEGMLTKNTSELKLGNTEI